MLYRLKNKISVLLIAGLIVFGTVNTVFYPDVSYGADEDVLTYTRISHAATPEVETFGNEAVTIDVSNSSRGYFGAKYTGENPRVKLIISKNDEEIIYDIPVDKYEEYVVLPFHAGSGEYEISVWESMGGKMFMSVLDETESIEMDNEALSFLYPSLNVDFDENSLAVQTAANIALTVESNRELANEVFNWIITTIEYDYDLEDAIKAGMRYATDIDEVMISKKGICLDYATIMAAMLRSQGIPAKVVVGLVEHNGEILFPKHSWVSVYLETETGYEWVLYDPTFKTSEEKGVGDSPYQFTYNTEYCY